MRINTDGHQRLNDQLTRRNFFSEYLLQGLAEHIDAGNNAHRRSLRTADGNKHEYRNSKGEKSHDLPIAKKLTSDKEI